MWTAGETSDGPKFRSALASLFLQQLWSADTVWWFPLTTGEMAKWFIPTARLMQNHFSNDPVWYSHCPLHPKLLGFQCPSVPPWWQHDVKQNLTTSEPTAWENCDDVIALENTDINDNMINSKSFQGKATFNKQWVKVSFTIYDKDHIYVPDAWEHLKLNEPRRWKSEEHNS